MPHRTTLRLTARQAACLLLALACAGCDGAPGLDAARLAYREGRFDEAHAGFAATVESDVAADVHYDAALAAWRAGEFDAGRASLLRARGLAQPTGAVDFLSGNLAFSRCLLAEQQAQGPEAEPFAFDVALRYARDARDAWQQAAAARDDWPAARRNVERALLKIGDLKRQKAEADRNRKNQKAGGQENPQVLPTPNANDDPPSLPDQADQPDGPEDPASAKAQDAALRPEQVEALLETLAAKEKEKRAVRATERSRPRTGVEKDW